MKALRIFDLFAMGLCGGTLAANVVGLINLEAQLRIVLIEGAVLFIIAHIISERYLNRNADRSENDQTHS